MTSGAAYGKCKADFSHSCRDYPATAILDQTYRFLVAAGSSEEFSLLLNCLVMNPSRSFDADARSGSRSVLHRHRRKATRRDAPPDSRLATRGPPGKDAREVGIRRTEVPSWPLFSLLVFNGTCWLCHHHPLVSALLERRGSSGIDAAGLEPPTQPILVSPVLSQERSEEHTSELQSL